MAAREAQYRRRFGAVGGLAARVVPAPQHVQAWAKGAAGEEKNARRLEALLADAPITLLHDRRIRGSRANIDHIAIGPGGVTVIDSKNIDGKVKVDWRGGLFSERTYDLHIGGRKRTNLVEGIERQVSAVTSALASAHLSADVRGVLCFTYPEGLPLLRHLRIRDVAIEGTRHTAKIIRRDGGLDETARLQIATALAASFPAT